MASNKYFNQKRSRVSKSAEKQTNSAVYQRNDAVRSGKYHFHHPSFSLDLYHRSNNNVGALWCAFESLEMGSNLTLRLPHGSYDEIFNSFA